MEEGTKKALVRDDIDAFWVAKPMTDDAPTLPIPLQLGGKSERSKVR